MAQMQVLARHVLTFLRSFYACSQKYKKVWHFLRKTLDICLRFGYNNTRRQGHGLRRKEYADVAELADALDSGSSGHCARAGSSPVIRSMSRQTVTTHQNPIK